MTKPRSRQVGPGNTKAPGEMSTVGSACPSISDIFEHARWIWPESPHWEISNSYALFRRTFTLETIPSTAKLFITADQSYRLYVNGVAVGRGPARGYQSHWPFDEIDVRGDLKLGRNVLAVRAHHPGRGSFLYISQDFAGLLVSLHCGTERVDSDASWKSLRQGSASRDTVPLSIQLFSQEHVDLRKEEGDWTKPEFDDSAWLAPTTRVWNAPPWHSLEPRGIPALQERRVEPTALLGECRGTSASAYQRVRDVVALRLAEERGHRPSGQTFRPLLVEPMELGTFQGYVLDFGRTVVGSLALSVEGADGGEIIDAHYVEMIDPDTLTPVQAYAAHSRVALGDRLVCRAGSCAHSFHHIKGFRYLALTVRDALSGLKINLHLDWVGYPLDRKGGFATSDGTLASIWEICAWTQQCCSLDAYVDTPWREQAQWWGDARVQAWNTFHLCGDPRLFRRGIAQIAGQTTPDGLTYGHAPTIAHSCVLPDFTLIWFLTLWDYYWQTGSTEPLITHHQTVQTALGYFERHTNRTDGLVYYDDRFWLFLDWTEIPKEGAPTLYNLWLLIALDHLGRLYRKARRVGEAVRLESWAAKCRQALRRLINSEGLIRDGVGQDGKLFASTSIHAQTLAIMAGLDGINVQKAVRELLLPFVRGEIQPKISPSAYWITYVFTILQGLGHGAEVVDCIRRRWSSMVAHGTTWESFEPQPGCDSYSHAWSAHPLYHLMQTVGGITQTGMRWSKIRYAPLFVGEYNETVIPTPIGEIRGSWHKRSTGIEVELQLPDGVRAEVILPSRPRGICVGNNRWRIDFQL